MKNNFYSSDYGRCNENCNILKNYLLISGDFLFLIDGKDRIAEKIKIQSPVLA